MARLIQVEQTHPEARQDQIAIGRLFPSSTEEDLKRCLTFIEDLGHRYEACEPDDHPWRARQPGFDLTPDTRRAFEETMQRCFEAVDAHDAFSSEHGVGLPLDRDPAEYRRRARAILERLQSLTHDADFPAIVMLYRRLQENAAAREAYREVRQLAERIGDAPLDERIDQLFPRLESQERSRTIELIEVTLPYRRWWLTWLRVLSSQYRTLRRQLRPKLLASGLAWSADELRSLKATLQGRADRERLDVLLGQLDMLDPASTGSDSERVQAAQTLERRLRLCVNLSEAKADFSQVAEVLRVMRRGEPDAVKAWQNQLHVALERCDLVQQCHVSLDGLCDLLLPPLVKNLKQEMNRGCSVLDELDRLQSTFATIPQLLAYQRRYERLDDSERQLIDHLIARHRNELGEGHSLAHHWRAVTEVSVFNKWRRGAIEEAPVLETIDEAMLGTLREDLRQALQSKMRVEAEVIHQHWTTKGREAVDERWKRYLRKRGRGAKRLREVVHRGHSLGLLKLRPCWLTNPETASQIFPLDEGLFDLVIFDEASQLPLEQAMPAIYRGHRVVVAGDEHQLPPTSFFQTSSSGADDILEDQDEDDADAVTPGGIARREGIEQAINCTDLLDLSKYILPDWLLNVHYRSRHPALIEFSNWAFYKGRLEAAHPTWGMPTPDAAPITFHRVNGVYEGRTNRTEALHVVNLLLYLWSQPGKVPTIGVVTFNNNQEELIEEEIARKASTEHNFRSLLEREKERKSGEKEVGFFVKNLESVQGDERDLIIFSTTFAPTEPGNPASLRRYFGPLTHSGGERRLNVAVTRARDGVIVVTSMPLERISDIHSGIEPGQTIKARDYLQAYMMYADAVSSADCDRTQRWLNIAARLSSHDGNIGDRSAIREFDSEFEEQVYDRLVGAGWAVDTQVGENNFKIDLAVRHPDHGKGYLLGIECDGATYHGGLTARARDIWREDILKEYGWRIYRIWSTRWWTFQDNVMEDLLGLLNDLIEAEPVTGSVLRQPLPEFDGLPLEPVAVPAKPRAPTGRPLPTPTMEPPPVELQFDGRPDAWAKQFECLVLERCPDEGEIASWRDPNNHLFEILLERHRGSPMVFLRREGEEFGHFSVREADPTVLRKAVHRLKGVKDHGDILDWFHWLHRELYPDLWAER